MRSNRDDPCVSSGTITMPGGRALQTWRREGEEMEEGEDDAAERGGGRGNGGGAMVTRTKCGGGSVSAAERPARARPAEQRRERRDAMRRAQENRTSDLAKPIP